MQRDFGFLYKDGKNLEFSVQQLISNINANYHQKNIKKSDGSDRPIDKPSNQLKGLQRQILKEIKKIGEREKLLHSQVFGLGKGRGIKENALAHKNNRYFLKLDIKDFFNSIKYTRVTDCFKLLGCADEEAKILTKLTTYNYYLPQGVPTSSILASICVLELDKRLARFCKLRKMVYTRYADDIAISSNKKIMDAVQQKAIDIASWEGLKVNQKKLERFDAQKRRCKLVGVIIKNGNLATAYHHGEEKHGFILENESHLVTKTSPQLMGVLAHIKHIDPKYYHLLIGERKCVYCNKLSRLKVRFVQKLRGE